VHGHGRAPGPGTLGDTGHVRIDLERLLPLFRGGCNSRKGLRHSLPNPMHEETRKANVDPCAHHMALWIRDGAAAHDSSEGLRPAPALAHAAPEPTGLQGLHALVVKAKINNPPAVMALEQELLNSGAISVDEVLPEDWENLTSWSLLGAFERRRFLAAV